MLWGAATVKVILGGLAGDDLREISELAGEYRETVTSWQRGHGGYSLSSSLQDRKTITPEEIRTLSAVEREALIIHATTPAVKARMTRHYEGPHRDVFAASAQAGPAHRRTRPRAPGRPDRRREDADEQANSPDPRPGPTFLPGGPLQEHPETEG